MVSNRINSQPVLLLYFEFMLVREEKKNFMEVIRVASMQRKNVFCIYKKLELLKSFIRSMVFRLFIVVTPGSALEYHHYRFHIHIQLCEVNLTKKIQGYLIIHAFYMKGNTLYILNFRQFMRNKNTLKYCSLYNKLALQHGHYCCIMNGKPSVVGPLISHQCEDNQHLRLSGSQLWF